MAVTKRSVNFYARGLRVAGILNVPEKTEEKKQNPAIVCVHPGSSCKDQTAGIYAVNAAMTEWRIKAVGTVAGANIGRVYRESSDTLNTLEAAGGQRTAEAKGAEPMIVNWIPNSQEEREKAGITDIDIIEAVDYYTTPRGQCSNSPNKLKFTSLAMVLGFDAFHMAEVLLTQPLQIIVGSKQGSFGSYRDGHELYEKAASGKKNLYILEGVSHYDLYDQPEPVKKAVEKLEIFYKENL